MEVMITKINHVGIVVKSIDDAVKLYTDVLGLKVKDIEVVEDLKIKTALIPVGESKIELIESTDPEGAIAKYIESRGEGIHHLAFEVSNIQDALVTLASKEMVPVDTKPRGGVGNARIAFLRPEKTKVLIEIVEPGE